MFWSGAPPVIFHEVNQDVWKVVLTRMKLRCILEASFVVEPAAKGHYRARWYRAAVAFDGRGE